MIFRCKKLFLLVIFLAIIIGSVVFYNRVFSYNDKITHPALTDNAVKIYNANFDKKLTNQEINWLKQGSINEDKAPRWMNHFYNPQTNQGLWGFYASKVWAQNPLAQGASNIVGAGGDQTWQKAISAYAKGEEQAAFLALGHILHLLEDATVPAHTRLDAHPNGDPYEDWTKNNVGHNINLNVVSDGISNLNHAFDELASYSNRYFFSEDTTPSLKELKSMGRFFKQFEGKIYECVKGSNNQCLLLVKRGIFGDKYYFDDVVHSDYFSLLTPKAVAYSAGVIDLFFREAEAAKQKEQEKPWWQKLKESASDLVSTVLSVNIYADLTSSIGGNQSAPSAAPTIGRAGEAPVNNIDESPPTTPMPSKIVLAQEIPEVVLPSNTVVAVDKINEGIKDIVENILPDEVEPPPVIVEDTTPDQTDLSKTIQNAVSQITGFIAGIGGPPPAPASPPSPSSSPALDTAPPVLINISSAPVRTSVSISWTSDELGVFQVEYGLSASYGLLSATTTLNSLTLSSLSPATEYHFRISARDETGNATSTADQIFTTSSQAENVVISEIKTAGSGGASDEWIELYNPTNTVVDISNWSIQYRGGASANFSKKNFTATSSIPAFGYFLIVNNNYVGGAAVDMTHNSFTMSAAGGNVFLVASHDTLTSATSSDIIDKLVYGSGDNLFPEGFVAFNPSTTQSLDRKSLFNSTAQTLVNGSDQWQGNGYDSDNNQNDFIIQSNPNPQNSLMLAEPRTSVPNLMTSSSWPTWQNNMRRTGLSAANSISTSTMAIKWTATTTPIHEFISRPVLDSEGNIYIGRRDGLAKYSPAGVLLWLYSLAGSGVVPAPLITADGTVYFRGDGGLYVINSSGQLKWFYPLSVSVGANSSIAVLSDGSIIVQSATEIYAINQDATLKWIFDSGRPLDGSFGITGPVIDSTDNIYMYFNEYVYKISPTGEKLWDGRFGPYGNLSLGMDNTLYFAVASTTDIFNESGFFALDTADGSIKWADKTGYNNRSELAPVVDAAGNAYGLLFNWGGVRRLKSYAVGTSTPTWISNAVYSINLATPIITADHKIYLADQQSVRVIDALTGKYLGAWDEPDGLYVNSYFGAVGADGTIYTAGSFKLYAIGNL